MDIIKKCRTCLSPEQNLDSSFNIEIINDKSITYSEMIYLCTNVQVIY